MPSPLPNITLPVVTIVPSTTFMSDNFQFSEVSYSLPLTIERQQAITANERMVVTAELSLIKLRKQIIAQVESLKATAFLLNIPAADFIDDILEKTIVLLTENRLVRQSILGGQGIAIATYAVCSNNRFGYEVILHVQTFDGVVVLNETRSKNASSTIVFNGQLVYLDGLALTGTTPIVTGVS